MTMRLAAREYEQHKGAGNQRKLQRLVGSGPPPGLIGYVGDEPVAWISLGPRADFARLATSRVLAPVDEQPVWSIVCLFVTRPWRRQGISRLLLDAASDYARRQGARLLEGYPQEPKQERMPDVFAWTGIASTFRKAGFVEVARRSPTRPIFRREVGKARARRRPAR
jgi:GNAT superfamily N-acetyltransferase